MKKPILAIMTLALLTGLFTGCATTTPETTTPTESLTTNSVLAGYGLQDATPTEIVDHLEELPVADRSEDFTVSVKETEILFQDLKTDKTFGEMKLPEGQQSMSFAPYIDHTHDCYYHSLMTCKGELGNETMNLTIVNKTTGETVFDKEITTYDNGYYNLWLPTNSTYDVTFVYGDYTGTGEYKTGPDTPTCITDLQLTKE